jgi:heptosyltransferase-2
MALENLRKMKRILIRGNTWLGDAVMSLPVIDGVRRMFPEAQVRVLTHPALAELYGAAAVAESNGYDAAVILPRSFRSAWEMYRAGIPRRIGFGAFPRSWLLTDVVPRDESGHRVRAFYSLLKALGDPPELRPPTIEVPESAMEWARQRLGPGRWFAVNPGATYGAAKQWLPDRFAELCRRLTAQVVVVGKEPVAGVTGTLDLTGQTSILQLAAVLKQVEVLITNDTGPMHVADAVGTRIISIFGPTDPVTTAPFRPHAMVRKPIECAPCLERTCPLGHHRCMTEISVEDVLSRV